MSIFIFQQGNLDEAEKFGELAKEADSYNSGAYVNLGNVALSKRDFEKAKHLYLLALDNDPSSIDALYNLGIFL